MSMMYATLTVGLSHLQQGLESLREKLYTDTVEPNFPSHDVDTETPSCTTTPGPKAMIGLNLVSKFVRGSIRPSVLLGTGFSTIRQAVDETAAALNENAAPRYDTIDMTYIDSAGQGLSEQQVHIETHDVGTQTNGTDRRKPLESGPVLRLGSRGESFEANTTLPEDNHGSQVDSLALTLFRPSQFIDPELEQLTADHGLGDVLLEDHTNVLEELNQENIRLISQRDDLLGHCTALENDLSTSFIEKMDLENRLSSAEKTIEKGRAYCERAEAEWKEDQVKLQYVTRLFEANTENEKHVEMLQQQNLLDEENTFLFGQLQMKTEDNRYLWCQREAVVRATEYDRVCAMTSEIEMLRRWLSTVQAQLADSNKANKRLEEELQQERRKHRATRNAFELDTNMGSSPFNMQHTAKSGGSAPQKPAKFTTTFPPAFQAPLPKAGAPPQLFSEQKIESVYGADPFFETCPSSTNIHQQYGTRSKSKFSFGDNTVPENVSTASGITNGATSRTEFNFTFGGTSDHHNSPSGYGNITGLDLPKDSTSPASIFGASTFTTIAEQTTTAPGLANCKTPLVDAESPQYLDEYHRGQNGGDKEHSHNQHLPPIGSELASKRSAEVKDNVDLLGGSGPKMTADNKAPFNFAKSADAYINPKAKKGARKPKASDFFDEDPVEAEVEKNTMNALAAEEIGEEIVPTVVGELDVAQKIHIGSGTYPNATVEGSVQAVRDNKINETEQGSTPTPDSPPPPSKANPSKQPKNKAKTSKRALLRKVAKERKRAAVGEADWSGTS